MTEEQLKIWFLDKFNACYLIKHFDYSHNIHMIYDIDYIRAKKLANILNKDIEYPIVIKGVCLFEQNFKSGILWCDYNKIWSVFIKNYSSNYQEISGLIKCWLEEHDKLKVLTTVLNFKGTGNMLEEHDKLKVLTTVMQLFFQYDQLEEHNKLKVLTTIK